MTEGKREINCAGAPVSVPPAWKNLAVHDKDRYQLVAIDEVTGDVLVEFHPLQWWIGALGD